MMMRQSNTLKQQVKLFFKGMTSFVRKVALWSLILACFLPCLTGCSSNQNPSQEMNGFQDQSSVFIEKF